MQSGQGRRLPPREFVAGVAVVLLMGLAVGGCTADGKPTASMAPRGTVAFDSIDGPPAGVFQKLVQNLNDEAEQRRVAVVSHEDASQYRVRGYLAAYVKGGRTSIAWVWDVYDADQRRALRILGEEPGSRGGRDPWSSADDQVLQRIARNGMDQLVAFLDAPEAASEAPMAAPAPRNSGGYRVAGNEDSPESTGIFRIFGAAENADAVPEAALARPAANEIPLPPRRPVTASLPPAGALAFAE